MSASQETDHVSEEAREHGSHPAQCQAPAQGQAPARRRAPSKENAASNPRPASARSQSSTQNGPVKRWAFVLQPPCVALSHSADYVSGSRAAV